MTIAEYKKKLLAQIERSIPHSTKPPLVYKQVFRKHPVSFESALDIARKNNPKYLIWNCCEYDHGYLFLIGSAPHHDPHADYPLSSNDLFYYHVHFRTGQSQYYSYLGMQLSQREAKKLRAEKTVWIDVSEEEAYPDTPELNELRKKILTVSLMEESNK